MSANVRACTREEVERAHGPALSILAHQLARELPEIGEQLATQMAELFKDPSPDRCDRMVVDLAHAQTRVRRLATEVMRGDPPTV